MRNFKLLASVAAIAVTFVADPVAAGEIRIGIIARMTGQLASEGQDMENVIKLAIADVDAKGGVLGQTITTVTADDACDPQQGATAGSKLMAAGVRAYLVGAYASHGEIVVKLFILRQQSWRTKGFVIPETPAVAFAPAKLVGLRSLGKRGCNGPFAAVMFFSHFCELQTRRPISHPSRDPRSEPMA
jgi:hypothetical protein